MPSKYSKYVHVITYGPDKGRFIVAYHDEEHGWISHNTLENPTADTYVKAAGLGELAKSVRTYANDRAAIKAVKRIYLERLVEDGLFDDMADHKAAAAGGA